ncbi:replication protein [Alteribacillus bidgolensis]|uniref:Phage replication protein O n=1 Tax=Alteribacillus bidgolensis TaxID=930129 RepID=A0A1G8P5D0_9BACI|nr:replication protein [Alteribacillus bidgolensis]SDI87663.1 phage replication protein O [Alteribacillus bidgolensis]
MPANPQKENGFTGIANEIFDVIAQCKFNGTQFRLLTIIWRYTYGFQRKSHPFSQSFLHEKTGLSKDSIKRGIKGLIDKKVLIVVKVATFSNPRELMFNKYYNDWLIEKDEPKTAESPQSDEVEGGGQTAPTPGGNLSPHINKELKESNKEIQLQQHTRDYQTSYELFENTINVMPNQIQQNQLIEWIKTLGDDFVYRAIEVACLNAEGPPTFRWLKYLIEEWTGKGARSPDDIDRLQEEFQKKKSRGDPGNGKAAIPRNHGQTSSQSRGSQKRSITGGQVGWIKPGRRA